MKVQVIIPAAGSGERMKSDIPKVFLKLGEREVISYTLAAFEMCAQVQGIVLVGYPDNLSLLKDIVAKQAFSKVIRIVEGGATRTQSVRLGLAALDLDTDIILVHDGARPLVSDQVIRGAIAAAQEHGAAVAGVRVKPTLKVVDPQSGMVTETLDRTLIREIQTPQAFRADIFRRAYQLDENTSDDAGLVEKIGVKVWISPGDYRNIKITTPEDLVVAEAFLKQGAGSVEQGK